MRFFWMLLLASFVAAGLVACSESQDGDWDSMRWISETKMGKGHVVEVPAEGGSYQFLCLNYSGFWLSGLQESGNNIWPTDEDVHHLSGEWISVAVEQNLMTVSIAPNGGTRQRSGVVGATAGDVFADFTFRQAVVDSSTVHHEEGSMCNRS